MNRMLPAKLVKRLDLDRLTLDDTELLDKEFKELFSDRLFRVPTKKGREVFVWILIEHQSRHDPMMALRVLEYATARWRSYRFTSTGIKKIPFLLPIVIQHDPQGWNTSVAFSDLYLVDDDEMLEDVGVLPADFDIQLDDLQAETEESLAA